MANGEFHKMHGLGNDFVIIDARVQSIEMSPARAQMIADRKFGIGCDQLILLLPSEIADVRMRIFNPDGSEVEACGNASRCVVALLNQDLNIETLGGIISGKLSGNDVEVSMGDAACFPHEHGRDATGLGQSRRAHGHQYGQPTCRIFCR